MCPDKHALSGDVCRSHKLLGCDDDMSMYGDLQEAVPDTLKV